MAQAISSRVTQTISAATSIAAGPRELQVFPATAGILILLWVRGLAPKPVGNSSSVATALQNAYQANLPQVEVAAAFLERVREEVTSRQPTDAAELTALAGKFVPLKTVLPELAKQLPKTLSKSSAVILRADATGYKILLNRPLCATVQFARSEVVDPVRNRDVLGCSYFGVWNEPAAKW